MYRIGLIFLMGSVLVWPASTAMGDPGDIEFSAAAGLRTTFDFSSTTMFFEVTADKTVSVEHDNLTADVTGGLTGQVSWTNDGSGWEAGLEAHIGSELGLTSLDFKIPTGELSYELGTVLDLDGIFEPISGFDSVLTGAGAGEDWIFEGDDTDLIVSAPEIYNLGDVNFEIYLPDDFNFGDLSELLSRDWTSYGGSLSGTAIPAPSALVLGLVGLGSLGWFRRRRRGQRSVRRDAMRAARFNDE